MTVPSFGRVLIAGIASAVFAAAARAQSETAIDAEVGWRFTDVAGDESMYRSQIDERPGLLLRALALSGSGFSPLCDTVRIDVADLGAGPAGSFVARLGKARAYDLRLTYRRLELYSALPAFANPLLDEGVVPGLHTENRTRNLLDVELTLLPGAAVSPIVGYVRNSDSGPGRTTEHVGEDEFRLENRIDDLDQEVHAGAAFDLGPVAGRVVQGWRKFRDTETDDLLPGAGGGDNPGAVLGIPVTVDSLHRRSSTVVNTPVTDAELSGRVGDRVSLSGSYERAAAESDATGSEDLTGSLASFALSRFFGGLSETSSARARSTSWNARGALDVRIVDDIDFTGGYARTHRDLDGLALVSSLYLDSVTFAGQDPRNLLDLLRANTSLDRTDEIWDAGLRGQAGPALSWRAGWSLTRQDIDVTEDASEIVLPGGQEGDFRRRIRGIDAAVSWSQHGITVGGDVRSERADTAVERIDFLDRDRYRLHAAWSFRQVGRLTASAEQTDASNDASGIGYDARMRRYGGTAEVTPVSFLRLRLSGEKFETRSRILIRVPQDFSVEESIHREDGRSLEGGFILALPPVNLDASIARYDNGGSFPFTLDRDRVRAEVALSPRASVIAEWSRDRYRAPIQPEIAAGNFEGNRYGLYLRWRQ